MLALVGKVAYKLQLPAGFKIHDVFHVSQLKAFHGTLPVATHIPHWLQLARAKFYSSSSAKFKFQNQAQVQHLVQWVNLRAHDATWEVAINFDVDVFKWLIVWLV